MKLYLAKHRITQTEDGKDVGSFGKKRKVVIIVS